MLSPRQREILFLVAQGYQRNEIADRLYITPQTVKTTLTTTFQKLGARNAPHAVYLWMKDEVTTWRNMVSSVNELL